MKLHFLNQPIMVSKGFLIWGLLTMIALISDSDAMWVLVAAYIVVWCFMLATDWYINRTAWKEIKEQDQTHPWED